MFKTWPTEGWDVNGLCKEIRFARSDTGFSNAEISMDWIWHFNRSSFIAIVKAKSQGVTFKDWFGYNEFIRDLNNPDYLWEQPYFKRPEKEKI